MRNEIEVFSARESPVNPLVGGLAVCSVRESLLAFVTAIPFLGFAATAERKRGHLAAVCTLQCYRKLGCTPAATNYI